MRSIGSVVRHTTATTASTTRATTTMNHRTPTLAAMSSLSYSSYSSSSVCSPLSASCSSSHSQRSLNRLNNVVASLWPSLTSLVYHQSNVSSTSSSWCSGRSLSTTSMTPFPRWAFAEPKDMHKDMITTTQVWLHTLLGKGTRRPGGGDSLVVLHSEVKWHSMYRRHLWYAIMWVSLKICQLQNWL
jgi:hypothetical protein